VKLARLGIRYCSLGQDSVLEVGHTADMEDFVVESVSLGDFPELGSPPRRHWQREGQEQW
jgi:hypothetical protein